MDSKQPKFEKLYQEQVQKSWNLMLSMIKVIALFIALFFVYTFIHKDVQAYLQKPTYDYAQLAKTAEKRAMNMAADPNRIEHGIHVGTGMPYDPNFELVKSACTSCHSSKLISQNRATREGWQQIIRWMQETQGLVNLGSAEPRILDYLSKHYAPEEKGRRSNLDMSEIEWYILEL